MYNRFLVVTICFACFIGGFFSFVYAAKIKNNSENGSDSLKYLGHAFIKIKTAQGLVIYIDPAAVDEFADSADIVLITHEHSDHNDLTRVMRKSTCQVVRSADALINGVYQTININGVTITAFPAYNSYHDKNSCVGYLVEFNGIRIYHAGDTGNIPEFADLAAYNITFAFLPMDGTYTMTPEAATTAAAAINAQHDMPIHTAIPPTLFNDAIAARFTSPHKFVLHPNESLALVRTSVKSEPVMPVKSRLRQNYPNPFNPATKISFYLDSRNYTTLRIYDALGRMVSILADGILGAGEHSVFWHADNFPSGIYFCRLQSGNFIENKKLTLIK